MSSLLREPRVVHNPRGQRVLTTGTGVRMEPLKAVRWKMAEQAAGMGIGDGSVIDLAYRVRVAEERWQTGRADGLGGVELEIAGMRVRAAS